MFDDELKILEDIYQLSEEVVTDGMRSAFSNTINGMIAKGSNTKVDNGFITTKIASFGTDNYYSIRFNNSSGFSTDKGIAKFDEYEQQQRESALAVFKSNPKHEKMLLSIIASTYAERRVKIAMKGYEKQHGGGDYPLTRYTEVDPADVTGTDLFTKYGDQGFELYTQTLKRLKGADLIQYRDDGEPFTNDGQLNDIIAEIPYVLVGSGSEYYMLKPNETVSELRNAMKSAISAHVPQGVTIHELIQGKFSTKVITPEKGAFINRIKDPSSNKPFDYKSQSTAALEQFHDDILKIFHTNSQNIVFGIKYDYAIMYLDQVDFDRVVKQPTAVDAAQGAAKFVGNRLNSAKGHMI